MRRAPAAGARAGSAWVIGQTLCIPKIVKYQSNNKTYRCTAPIQIWNNGTLQPGSAPDPRLRAIARETDDGDRPIRYAMLRADSPTARPRDISSRSASESRNAARRRGAGSIRPDRATNRRTVTEHIATLAR